MKIIICTTFRDFKGTDNDKIQYMFLDNIKRQTYQDYLVVTTTFGEKRVKDVVDGYFGEKSITRDVVMPEGHRFSLTDVVLTGIQEIEKLKEESILIWCTCDIMFEPNFFQKLVDCYKPGISGIIHPNLIYSSLSDMQSNLNVIIPIDKGIDILFFDGNILKVNKQDIIDNRFYDWGVFEYFLVSMMLSYSNNRVNLFCKSKVKKVVNNRKLTDESKEYFRRCLAMNEPILAKFCEQKRIPYSIFYEARYHNKFKLLNPRTDYYKVLYLYRYEQFIKRLKKKIAKVLK